MSKKIPVLIIGGPTAVGKTALSIEIAKKYNGEIINGDSLQVYRGLNIGTGKVTNEEMQGIPHHLLDILEPHQQFDAHQFKLLASKAVEKIHLSGKLPIICGGTGLYLEGFLFDFSYGGKKISLKDHRQIIEDKYMSLNNHDLWHLLSEKDIKLAQSIPQQNRRRILRAFEVFEHNGNSLNEQEEHKLQASKYRYLLLVLDCERQALYNRINQRVQSMIQAGLESEVRFYYNKYHGDLVAGMKGIGYKEWWPYFQGNQNLTQVVETIQKNSRRYAKRQLTWFRNRFKKSYWINANQARHEAINLIEDWMIKGETND